MQDEYEHISFFNLKVIKKESEYRCGMYVTKYTLSSGKIVNFSCLSPVDFDHKILKYL